MILRVLVFLNKHTIVNLTTERTQELDYYKNFQKCLSCEMLRESNYNEPF